MPDVRRFDEFMDIALYGPSGFYVRGGRPAARGGDFATSVELGTLFARCVASYLDRTWNEMGRPDPFVVVEGGAGRGTLCVNVLGQVEACSDALQYVMVERVEHQRTEALARVEALGTDVPVTALADLPSGPLTGVVLANELLDNLPFRLLERSATGWQEVCVADGAPDGAPDRQPDRQPDGDPDGAPDGDPDGAPDGDPDGAPDGTPDGGPHSRPSGSAGQPVSDPVAEPSREAPSDVVALALPEAVRHVPSEVLIAAPDDATAMADALAPHAESGARVPLQLKAAVWIRRALRLLERGSLLVFDYGVPTTAELTARPMSEWLRTYRAHRRGHDPLGDPGSADITCEVAFDQLPPGASLVTQSDWLAAEDINGLTAAARSLWQRSRASPTADALAARTLLDEAAALTDPSGMGGFWAAEWRAG